MRRVSAIGTSGRRASILAVLLWLTLAGAWPATTAVAASSHGPNLWSGQWNTSTGGLGFRLMTASDISVAKTEAQHKQLYDQLPCNGPQYYRGGYFNSTDAGKVLACGTPMRLQGRWVSNNDPTNHGSFDIAIDTIDVSLVADSGIAGDDERATPASPLAFDGVYTPDGKAFDHRWTGQWSSDFGGDGCCPDQDAKNRADAKAAVQAALGKDHPLLASVIGRVIDDKAHPLNLVDALLDKSRRGPTIAILSALAAGHALAGSKLADFLKAHPGEGPLFKELPKDVNFDAAGRNRKLLFLAAAKQTDPARRVGAKPNDQDFALVEDYAKRLRTTVEPVVFKQVQALANAVNADFGPASAPRTRPRSWTRSTACRLRTRMHRSAI
jgi:hypothetical protein